MNRWGIPEALEQDIRTRDPFCVYCGIRLIEKAPRGGPRRAVATWEHIVNDARIVTRENIARCCAPCNSSKGARLLAEWLDSPYCLKRGINGETVADVVKTALRPDPSLGR